MSPSTLVALESLNPEVSLIPSSREFNKRCTAPIPNGHIRARHRANQTAKKPQAILELVILRASRRQRNSASRTDKLLADHRRSATAPRQTSLGVDPRQAKPPQSAEDPRWTTIIEFLCHFDQDIRTKNSNQLHGPPPPNTL